MLECSIIILLLLYYYMLNMSFLSSLQGISLFSLREGLTGQPGSSNTDSNGMSDATLKQKVADVMKSYKIVNTEYLSYDPKMIETYGDKNVKLSDGTIGYVTKQGVFKKYPKNKFNGGEGCTSFLGVSDPRLKNLNTKTNPQTGSLYTYTNDSGQSFLIYDDKYVMLIGSEMIDGQPCGYAGQNIYVGNLNDNNSTNSDKQFDYQGCKDASLLTSEKQKLLYKTDLKLDYKVPQCPAGTFASGITGVCYDPVKKNAVSTFMKPQYDQPIDSKAGNVPYLAQDGQTYLWFRSSGPGEFGQRIAPTMPACPDGTLPCKKHNGHCYDPDKRMMVTTIDPNRNNSKPEPKYMELVNGGYFNGKPNILYQDKQYSQWEWWNRLQQWWPDGQFQNPNYAPHNKIYLQFKAVAAELMTHLKKNGDSISVTVLARSAPNGGTFTVTRNSDTQATGRLIYGGNHYANYTFNPPIPSNYIEPIDTKNKIKLWKSNISPADCGRPLEVPKTTEFDEKLAQCREIANASFKDPIYGFKDGYCHVGSSTEIGELLTQNANKKCASITKQTNNGQNGGFAAYKSGGSGDTSLFNFGFVTADETLRAYPKGNEFFTPTNKFFKMGDNRVIRSPRFPVGSFQTKHFEGGDILSNEACGNKCISTFGNDCEAYNFTRSGNTGKCTIYGQGSLGEKGIIIPSSNNPLYVREKKINNDDSCPKNFASVKSSIWEKMPNAQPSQMETSTKCNLKDIMESDLEKYNMNVRKALEEINKIKGTSSNIQRQEGNASQDAITTSGTDLVNNLGAYDAGFQNNN